MKPSTGSRGSSAIIDEFCSITGAEKSIAENLLEACQYNLEMAINVHMEGTVPSNSLPPGGASNASGEDEVRAPIPQRQEVLVGGPDEIAYAFRGRRRFARSVFDKFRNFEAETKRQEEELMRNLNSDGPAPGTSRNNRLKNLEELFRPPIDLIYRATFQAARDAGVNSKKWLMVNIQDSTEFGCQVLNRDVWSNSAVKTIIKEHFIFWQVYQDSEEGQRYMTFYKVFEWPHVAILDPRTGERLVTWNRLDALTFCDLVTEFLSAHPNLDAKFSPPKKKPRLETNDLLEADEASQIEAAIKASLQQSEQSEASKGKGAKRAKNGALERTEGKSDKMERKSDKMERKSDKMEGKLERTERKLGGSGGKLERTEGMERKTERTERRMEGTEGKMEEGSEEEESERKTERTERKTEGTERKLEGKMERTEGMERKTEEELEESEESEGDLETFSDSDDDGHSRFPCMLNGSVPQKMDASKMDASKLDASKMGQNQEFEAQKSQKSVPQKSDTHKTAQNSALVAPKSDPQKSDTQKSDTQKSDTQKSDTQKSDTQKSGQKSGICPPGMEEMGQMSRLILRLPDGTRTVISLPCISTVEVLVDNVGGMGYPREEFEIVANFPRRNITELSPEILLKDAGLYPQETLFIQAR